jgi:branched-chain amino acid transport system permease protein
VKGINKVSGMLSKLRVRPVWFGVFAIAVIVLFMTGTQSSFSVYVLDSVLLACLGAIALNLLMGTAGQVSIGTSAFLLLGAFSSVFFIRSNIPLPAVIVLSVLVCGVGGLIFALPALRLRSLFFALSTLSAYFIAVFCGNQYEDAVPGAGSGGFQINPVFPSVDLARSQQYWALLLAVLVILLILVVSRLMRERSGRAWRIIREHEFIAPVLGVRVSRYKLIVFALSSMVMGLEGSLMAYFSGSVTTDEFTLQLSILYVAMVLVGGLDSIAGAVIGATILTALPIELPQLLGHVLNPAQAATDGPQYAIIVYGLLIIVFICSSPRGVIGWLWSLRRSRVASNIENWMPSLFSRASTPDEAPAASAAEPSAPEIVP